jgi:acyl carrier protein
MAAVTADDVLDLIAEESPVERSALNDRDATLESLGVASLDMISVLFALEDKFGVVVETEEAQGATTLGGFVDLVLAKAREGGGAPAAAQG